MRSFTNTESESITKSAFQERWNTMARIVIALGGNALGNTAREQQEKIDQAAPALIHLIQQGNNILVSHGNGPQVGMIHLAFDEASKKDERICKMDLPECTAMSQGYIGYHLQKGITHAARKAGKSWKTATVVTQVLVDGQDPAFRDPRKPIGNFYNHQTAVKLMQENPGVKFVEDAGRGWRQVVASPKPVDILEKEAIKALLDDKFIVIACGGGGVPVIQGEDGNFHGVSAVIDKDFSAAKLAELVDAEYLFILTAVEHVAINFGKPNQKELWEMSLADAEKYCAEGQFAAGSMLPKVQAAMNFVKSGQNRKAIIASLERAGDAIRGESGTVIHQ